MKKHIFLLLTVITMLFSCNTADYYTILAQLRDHEERIQKLEALCNQLNSNVEAIQTILKALEHNDYITDITKITESGVEIGYSITFAKGGTVNIYHGSNGSNAQAPKISIRKAPDGEYYWTSGDEWLTDENGEKLLATYTYGSDGGNESDVRYITPLFRIVENEWYISYDNGNTWRTMQALTDEGMIADVEIADEYVTITLADGTPIKVLRWDGYGRFKELMEGTNDSIETLQTLVDAFQNSEYIKEVIELYEGTSLTGFEITLVRFTVDSEGIISERTRRCKIQNGMTDPSGATVTVDYDENDDAWYWILNGQQMKDTDGNPICADRDNESSGSTLEMRINPETGEWEFSCDNGVTFQSAGVAVTGDEGNASEATRYIKEIIDGEDFIIFLLHDDSELKIPSYDFIDEDVISGLLKDNAYENGEYTVRYIKVNGVVIPILEKNETSDRYYQYQVTSKGILSPNDIYRKTPIYAQTSQDGTIYKGLSFSGNGAGKVTIRAVVTGVTVGSMNWDKKDILKPHDNSVTHNIEYRTERQLDVTWTLNSTYSSADGSFVKNGPRTTTGKFLLSAYKDLSIKVTSSDYLISCYDSDEKYLGQISTSLNSLIKGYAQWNVKGTVITESIIKEIDPDISYIAVCTYDNELPDYMFTYKEGTCFIYSNIYNNYASAQNRHIGECCVYQLSDEDGTWTNELKQVLRVGFINDPYYWTPASEIRPYGNFVVDKENQFLYVYVMYNSKSVTQWYKFYLPKSDEGEWSEEYECNILTLNTDDIIDSWTTELQNIIQGACVHDNLIYSTEGSNGTGTNAARMRVVDPSKKKVIAVFEFFADDDPVEPEFIDFFEGRCFYGSAKQMYNIDFL